MPHLPALTARGPADLAAPEKLGLRAAGTHCRTYGHAPTAMLAVLQEHGLRRGNDERPGPAGPGRSGTGRG
ncbi:hypothetical protein ACWCOM_15700 [Kocuria sp. KH4]